MARTTRRSSRRSFGRGTHRGGFERIEAAPPPRRGRGPTRSTPVSAFALLAVAIGCVGMPAPAQAGADADPPPDATPPDRGPLLRIEPWDWDGGGPIDDPEEDAACTLRLCCALVDAIVVEGWHCWTTCTRTDADGTVTTTACRAEPTGLFRDLGHGTLPDCPGWTIFDGAWGPIDTYCGPWDASHPDFGLPATECIEVRTPGTGCDTCGCVAEVFDRIEDCCVRFELLPELYGWNDNSAAATALAECGVLGALADLARANPEWGSPLFHLLRSAPGFPAEPLDFGTPGWRTIIPLGDCEP